LRLFSRREALAEHVGDARAGAKRPTLFSTVTDWEQREYFDLF